MVEYGYLSLLGISFGAATILPLSSEVVFIGMLAAGFNPYWCLLWASVGNTLGGLTNYYFGYLGKEDWLTKICKLSPQKVQKVKDWVRVKGALTAFFSFLPGIGDLIPFLLGYMRANVHVVWVSMCIGKLFRYILLMTGTLALI